MSGKRMPPAPTLDEVRKLVNENWAEWCDGAGSPEAIRSRVHTRLNRGVEAIVASLLGFERSSWGEWRIDHCNGRSGDSAIGDYLRAKAKEACESWMDKYVGDLPELPKSALAELKKEYVEMYRGALRARLRELAKSRAERVTREMIDSLEPASNSDMEASL